MIRNRVQTLIQALSLVVGIAAMILTALYARYETTFDQGHENFDRIYRLEFGDRVGQPTAPGHQIKQNFSEVENVVRIVNWEGKGASINVQYEPEGDSGSIQNISISDYYWADSSIFEVFSIELIQGDPQSALRDPFTVVLAEPVARRIFGDEDPIGKSLGWLTVSGVMKELEHSHIKISMLISMTTDDSKPDYPKGTPAYLNNYSPDYSYITFVLLAEHQDPRQVEDRINSYFRDNTPVWSGIDFDQASYRLRPLKEIYFATDLRNEKNYSQHGNIRMLWIVITIAVFVLLLAIINYVNLTTARASLRAKEIGIRKVNGSSRLILMGQVFIESILVSLISFLIAILLAILVLPSFNSLMGSGMDLHFVFRPLLWLFFFLAALLVGILSGIYPAIVLTGFKPVDSLYGQKVQGSTSLGFRQFLLTFQFIISIFLLVGVMVVYNQISFMKQSDLGFNQKSVLNINYYRWIENAPARDLIKEEMESIAGVKGVAFSQGMMGGEVVQLPQSLMMEAEKVQINYMGIDPDFLTLMEISLSEGRDFSRQRPADYAFQGNYPARVIINETGVRELGLADPVGSFLSGESGPMFEIIGVVEDIHFNSQHKPIESCLFLWSPWINMASIRLEEEGQPETLAVIEEKLEELEPQMVFEYTFLEDYYAIQYLKDEQTAGMVRIFALIALLIACLGLYGLASFMAVRKTREFGIRKIMGATVQSLTIRLIREFSRWVFIAICIAIPLSWWLMSRWLQGFAYHTRVGIWMLLLAAAIALLITILTVLGQSLKTARINPVDALRDE